MAALPTKRVERRALTASASRLRSPLESAYGKRMSMPWQYRALSQFDMIPELHFANHFIARQLSRCRFFPARLNDDGTTTPIKEGLPVEVWKRVQDPGGGRSQLQYNYGRLMSITGEGVAFGYRLGESDERWKFLWKDEVKIRDDGTAVRLDWEMKETSDVGVAYRMWNPHPRHSDLPDSPMQAVSDIAEELIILTQTVRSTATTRMTNGILVMPLEAIPNPADVPQYLGDEDPETNPFLEDYIEHVTAQIENYGSPEAAVSFLYTPPYEFADRVSWLKTHDPATDYMEKDLRKEAIERLALGLDMPPEALTGLGGANHWGGKAIQLDMWRAHGVNKADAFGDDWSDAYLRPSLEEEGYPEPESVVLPYDDSQVVISPDQSQDADAALDRGAIGWDGYLELKGIPKSMEASDEERSVLLSVKMRQPVEIKDGELVPISGPVAQNVNVDPTTGPPLPTNGRVGSRQEAMRASVVGWSEMGLARCRTLAGVRIRHKCPDCAEGVSAGMVAAVLGSDYAKDPRALVSGGSEDFTSLCASVMPEEQAIALGQTLEVYAAKTLCEPKLPVIPSGFVAQIDRALEVGEDR